jgi:TRAP-type uncharacterized transport system substrate-binding protein
MLLNHVGTLLIVALIFSFRIDVANAQTIPKSIQQGGSDTVIKQRKNAWTVGIAGGLIDGTYMRFADELGKVLDDGDNLRVLPMVSYGAASNLDDLLYLRGVDLAVTQSDVFEYFRTERKTPNLQNRIHFMLRLPIAELHILAKTDIRTVEDLRGKRVNFGPAGSGSSLTGTIVFQRLGVQVEQVLIDQQSALQRLQSGEVAALVRVVGKPVDFFTKVAPNSGLHLIVCLRVPSRTITQQVSSRRRTIPCSLRWAGRSTLSPCRQSLRYLIGRKAAIDTAASSVLPSGSSVIGTSFWLRLDIPNGGT